MVFSVIYLRPRAISISHCEACGLTHPHEETNCVASKDPYKNVNSTTPMTWAGTASTGGTPNPAAGAATTRAPLLGALWVDATSTKDGHNEHNRTNHRGTPPAGAPTGRQICTRCGEAMGDDVHIARIRTISAGGGPALVSAGNMVATHLTFYSLPDALPFLVRLTMMVATQVVVGKALQRPER